MLDNLEPGRLVVSTAGRDCGKYYLVLEEAAGDRVCVVDGEARRIVKPKRKNRKHLKPLPDVSLELNEKIKAGVKITDHEVRRALREITANYT
ncbi:MAG: RNA-binding protein [Bacillota bacterium]